MSTTPDKSSNLLISSELEQRVNQEEFFNDFPAATVLESSSKTEEVGQFLFLEFEDLMILGTKVGFACGQGKVIFSLLAGTSECKKLLEKFIRQNGSVFLKSASWPKGMEKNTMIVQNLSIGFISVKEDELHSGFSRLVLVSGTEKFLELLEMLK